MTPAITALDAAGVAYSIHEYDHGDGRRDFGLEAAEKLDVDPARVFKTLVVDTDDGLAVAVVPVMCQLSLKAAAKALGVKRAVMGEPAAVERSTGYVRGGISPFGQKRALATVVDESIELFDEVLVSGGKRGFDIGIAPGDLIAVTNAQVADITS